MKWLIGGAVVLVGVSIYQAKRRVELAAKAASTVAHYPLQLTRPDYNARAVFYQWLDDVVGKKPKLNPNSPYTGKPPVDMELPDL